MLVETSRSAREDVARTSRPARENVARTSRNPRDTLATHEQLVKCPRWARRYLRRLRESLATPSQCPDAEQCQNTRLSPIPTRKNIQKLKEGFWSACPSYYRNPLSLIRPTISFAFQRVSFDSSTRCINAASAWPCSLLFKNNPEVRKCSSNVRLVNNPHGNRSGLASSSRTPG